MDSIRAFVRLVLPPVIRRPIANKVYYVLAHLINFNNFIYKCTRSIVSRFLGLIRRCRIYYKKYGTRKALYRAIFWPLRKLNSTLERNVTVAWPRVAPYRYLLSMEPGSLPLRLRMRRAFLKLFLSLSDPYHKYVFHRVDTALSHLDRSDKKAANDSAVFIIGGLGPGGSERQVVLTMCHLSRLNYGPLSLYCQHLQDDSDKFYLHHLESAGIPVKELNLQEEYAGDLEYIKMMQVLDNLPPSLSDIVSHVRALLSNRPSVAHLWLDEVNIKAGIAAVIVGVPRIILSLRSLPPYNFPLHHPYMREAYRWLVRQDGVVMINNSRAGARAYERWLGLSEGTIKILHNGFDFDERKLSEYQKKSREIREHCRLSSELKVIGTVMRFTEEKRPALWIDTAIEIINRLPDVKFLIVGDGPLREALQVRVVNLGLDEKIIFTGHVREPFHYISAMDMFLLTSRAEGLPNVLIEAQALGVPVVTTNVGGAPETLSHGVTGWIVESDNPVYMAEVLSNLLQDDEWMNKARSTAPGHVKSKFGIDRMIEETLLLYETHLGERSESDRQPAF